MDEVKEETEKPLAPPVGQNELTVDNIVLGKRNRKKVVAFIPTVKKKEEAQEKTRYI